MSSLPRFANRFASLLPRLALAGAVSLPLALAFAPVGCGSNADMVPTGLGGTVPGTGGMPAVDGGAGGTPGPGPGEPDASEPEVQTSVCPTFPLIPLTLTSADGAQPAIVWNGTNYFAVWSGGPVGTGDTAGNIYGALLDAEGNKVGDDILIADTANLATSPEVVPTPAGPGVEAGFTLVFEDCIGPTAVGGCSGGASVQTVLLGADGKPLGAPVVLSPAVQEQRRPYIATGPGNVYVTFRDVVAGPPPKTVARLVRLDAAGAAVGEGVIVDSASNGRYPHVAVGPTGVVALAYEREKTTSDIVLALFDPALTPVIEVPVRTGIKGDASNPVVQWNSTRWVIAWEDERDDEAKIYATVVDADGTRVGPIGCSGATCEPEAAYDENGNWPAIASGDQMTSLIGFYGYPGRRVFLARLEASGKLKPGQVVLGVGKYPSVAYNTTTSVYAVVYEDDSNHRVMLGRFKCTD
jgi:hypothetical protein